jgi:DNA modification methylase
MIIREWKERILQQVPIGSLTPNNRNSRTHTKRQIRKLADVIGEFGFTSPVLIDEDYILLAGHARLEAAKLLGLKTVPAIRISDMTAAQKRAYVIADNRLAELAGWDKQILADELEFLSSADLDFNVELTGFDTAEVDRILTINHDPAVDDDEELELPERGLAVTQVGDVWEIAGHRLICGDARDPTVYAQLLGVEQAQMVFTDPPYNVRIDGHVSGLGKVKHREFAMASGEMSPTEFITFLRGFMEPLVEWSCDGSIHYICMDWKHLPELLAAGHAVYSEWKNLCVWNKTNAGMGAFYRSQHELVAIFKSGTATHINNLGLGEKGRHRSNVWTYAGVNTFRKGRDKDLSDHPTVKPVALVRDAILDCSKRNGIVLDPFMGSGTTLIAAHRASRRGRGIELDPYYVDVAIRRLEKETGAKAVLPDGMTFDEAAAWGRGCERGEAT